MIAPQPDDDHQDFSDEACDQFLQELFASPIQTVLPIDALAAAHEAMSQAFQESTLHPLSLYSDEERAESLRSDFYQILLHTYPEPEQGYPGIIRHSAYKEVYEDGSDAISIVVELRSTQGSCMLGNREKLYEVAGGPVLLWLREDSERGIIVRALYSDGAFHEELKQIKEASNEFLAERYDYPLVFSALMQSIDSINRLFKHQIAPIRVDEIRPSPDLPGHVITLQNGNDLMYVEVYCDPDTRGLHYLIQPKYTPTTSDDSEH